MKIDRQMSSSFPVFRSREQLIWTLCLLIGFLLWGCETGPPRLAFEGNPMPGRQVASFMQTVSPASAYDTPPKFLKGYAPFFPSEQAQTRRWGYAAIEFTVDKDGTTSDFVLITATAPAFAKEAVLAVHDWTFTPAQKHGEPVKVRVRLPFTFRV